MRTSRSALLRGALAALACAALAPQPRSSADELRSGWVAESRATFFCAGGGCPHLTAPRHGLYPLDAPYKRASVRFTAPSAHEASSLWLRLAVAGAPGTLHASLQGCGLDGRPDGVPLAESELAPQQGWQEIPLVQPVPLREAHAYHVVLETAAGVHDAANHAALVALVARHPVQHQPQGAAGPADPRSAPDALLGLLYAGAPGDPLELATDEAGYLDGVTPVFAVSSLDGTAIGQPYDQALEERVEGARWRGQQLALADGEPARSFDYVAFYVRGVDLAQTDRLYASVLDAASGAELANALVLDPNLAPTVNILGRSHWYGARLSTPVVLAPGPGVVLALRSDDAGALPRGYVFPYAHSRAEDYGLAPPSYGGELSYAVRSSDGGASFQRAGVACDAAFAARALEGRDEALAIYDEGEYPRAASPGSLSIRIVPRNIGTATGTLVVRLIDRTTRVELAPPKVYRDVPPNRDAGLPDWDNAIAIEMPPHDLVLEVRCAHLDASGAERVDDRVHLELRALP